MQSPELLLAGLNRALRDLRAAAHVLKDEQIDTALLPIMRRLLVAEVVGGTWIVAIGGSQSAGKTTLVRNMYDLHDEADDWLPPNDYKRTSPTPPPVGLPPGIQVPRLNF